VQKLTFFDFDTAKIYIKPTLHIPNLQ